MYKIKFKRVLITLIAIILFVNFCSPLAVLACVEEEIERVYGELIDAEKALHRAEVNLNEKEAKYLAAESKFIRAGFKLSLAIKSGNAVKIAKAILALSKAKRKRDDAKDAYDIAQQRYDICKYIYDVTFSLWRSIIKELANLNQQIATKEREIRSLAARISAKETELRRRREAEGDSCCPGLVAEIERLRDEKTRKETELAKLKEERGC